MTNKARLEQLTGREHVYTATNLHLLLNDIEDLGFAVDFWEDNEILVSKGKSRFSLHVKSVIGTSWIWIDKVEKA